MADRPADGPRYAAPDLIACTTALFHKAGLDEEIAAVVAEILVEADLLGYATHGLQFVPAYMKGLETGRWTTEGEPAIVTDNGAAFRLDANWLPGQWATVKALELAMERAHAHPVVTVAMGRSHNISCLATYCKRAAEAGYLIILATSAPGNAAVAPFGAAEACYSTSPFAAGIPTDTNPIFFDTATSATTNRMIERTSRAGERLSGKTLIRPDGTATDDPDAFPDAAIMPAGGLEAGHKGFAWAILVEALTSGLAGWGRAPGDHKPGGNTVFLQLIDPARFGGAETFTGETGHFAELCRSARSINPDAPVRMPGDRAYRLYTDQLENGVRLHPEILPRMQPLLEKYGVPAPEPASA